MPICPLLSWLPSQREAMPIRSESLARFEGRSGYVEIDQIRTVDRDRLLRRLGKLSPSTLGRVLTTLQEMFTP